MQCKADLTSWLCAAVQVATQDPRVALLALEERDSAVRKMQAVAVIAYALQGERNELKSVLTGALAHIEQLQEAVHERDMRAAEQQAHIRAQDARIDALEAARKEAAESQHAAQERTAAAEAALQRQAADSAAKQAQLQEKAARLQAQTTACAAAAEESAAMQARLRIEVACLKAELCSAHSEACLIVFIVGSW